MALPLLRLSGNGRTVAAACWHRPDGRREPVMVWPLWRRRNFAGVLAPVAVATAGPVDGGEGA